MTTTTERHEIEAWLGEDWTDTQREQIIAAYLAAEPHTPDAEREALLAAIAQRVDGTLDRAALVADDQAAQLAAAQTRLARRAALRADVAAGMSESEAARVYGVARETVRKWMGKPVVGWN